MSPTPDRPPFLEVSTAMGCPVDCHFCPQTAAMAAWGQRPRLMPLETYVTCLDKTPAETEVSFAGFAEPFLNNALPAMAEATHARGRQWEMYTTLVGASEADVDRIAAAKPIRIKLHLADEEGYAKIKVDEPYLRVVLRLLELLPYPVTTGMTMGTLPEPLVRRLGKIKASVMHSRAGNVTVKVTPPRRSGPLRCRPGPKLDRNILLPDGSLVLCCMDFGQRHVIGNLLSQSWDEIRNGEALTALRQSMASQDGDCLCRTCELSERA